MVTELAGVKILPFERTSNYSRVRYFSRINKRKNAEAIQSLQGARTLARLVLIICGAMSENAFSKDLVRDQENKICSETKGGQQTRNEKKELTAVCPNLQ